jgi:hypothetical protein
MTVTSEALSLALTQDECEVVQRVWKFSQILCAAGLLYPEHVGDFMEKPWKWQPEFDLWHAHGCPDLAGDAGKFDAFSAAGLRLFDDTQEGA